MARTEMNRLEKYIADHKLDETLTMNRLDNAGVISNNAVSPKDVATKDCDNAVNWLIRQSIYKSK